MATFTKKFHFISSAESWVGSPGAGTYIKWELRKGKASKLVSPFISQMGGTMWLQVPSNTTATTGYLEYTGNWESLGVTPGLTVTSVKIDYYWRLMSQYRKHNTANTTAFGATACGAGPFEIRTNAGVLIGTTSTIQYAPARSGAGDYSSYPSFGRMSSAITNDIPFNYVLASGSGVAIPNHSSTTSIKLRINATSPTTDARNSGGGQTTGNLILKFDRVLVTVTASSPQATMTGVQSMTGVSTITFS